MDLRLAIVLLLVTPALAGCADPAPQPQSLGGDWLVQDRALVRQATAASLTPVAWGWSEFDNGTRPGAIAMPPVDQAWQIDAVHFSGRFFVRRDAATPPGSDGAFLVWLSVDDRFVSRALAAGPSELRAGEVRDMEVRFVLPEGGVYVPEGASVAIHLGSQYQDGAQRIALQSGTTHASGIRIDAHPTAQAEGEWQTVLEVEGHTGVGCTDDNAHPNAGFLGEFQVPEEAQALRGHIERGSGPGLKDMDLQFYGPSGRLVAETHAPDGDEVLLLGPENLAEDGAGTWRARAWCQSQQAPYRVTVEALLPP